MEKQETKERLEEMNFGCEDCEFYCGDRTGMFCGYSGIFHRKKLKTTDIPEWCPSKEDAMNEETKKKLKECQEMKERLEILQTKIDRIKGEMQAEINDLREQLNTPEKWEPPGYDEWGISANCGIVRNRLCDINQSERDSGHTYPDIATAGRIASHLRKRDRLTRRMVELDPEAGEFIPKCNNLYPAYYLEHKEWTTFLTRTFNNPAITYTRSTSACDQICQELNSGFLEL